MSAIEAQTKQVSPHLTYDDLAARWNCCRRTVKRKCLLIGLKSLDLGHTTVLFRVADVERSEERWVNRDRSKKRKGARP